MKRRYYIIIGIIVLVIGYNYIFSTDSEKADTLANNLFFKEVFDMDKPEDVFGLYCYSEHVGLDGVSQLKFQCDSSTIKKIVQNLSLTKADKVDNYSYGIWRQLPNWDIDKITTLIPFFKKDERKRIYWYLWYDSINKTAYYINFDM